MSEFLLREMSPFSEDVWKQIDATVEEIAKQHLVGRRFISLFGPLGLGALAVPVTQLAGKEEIRVGARDLLQFTVLQQDFVLSWEEFTTAKQLDVPVDLSPVAAAAMRLAQQEDELIFDGLRRAKGAESAPLGEWEKSGGAFAAVAAALEKLISAGIYGPYALVMNPGLYAQLQRVMAGTGRLEIVHVRELLGGNVYFAPALKAREAFLVANAPYNLDLAVAQDMITAYTGNQGLDHSLRLMEKIALRIKRPNAICILK